MTYGKIDESLKPQIDESVIDEIQHELWKEVEREQRQSTESPRGFQYTRGAQYDRASSGVGNAGFAPRAAPTPQPLPQPSKGRWLSITLLLSVLGFGGYSLWNGLLRYAAYGIVTADVVDVAAPIAGSVRYQHVRVGSQVQQGQLIVTLHDLDAEHRVDRMSDELRLAQANLSAEIARLQWQLQLKRLDREEASADYHEAAAGFEEQVAAQAEVEQRLERARKLRQEHAISQDEFDRRFYDHQGQTEKISRLRIALTSWRKRANAASLGGQLSLAVIDPLLVQIDSLKGELGRVRESLTQREVRSPVNGRIAEWHVRAGEFASKSEVLFTVIEEESTHVRLYLPQRAIHRFALDQSVDLEVSPIFDRVPFAVSRIGNELVTPPQQIERYYTPHEKLLPVQLRLKHASLERSGIPVGSLVRLPSAWRTH